jgi:ribosome biogenesis ATPase
MLQVQPSALREGFATVPDTTWEQIGSLENVKKELELSLLAPGISFFFFFFLLFFLASNENDVILYSNSLLVQHRDKFESVGLKSTSRGVLLYGPPGTEFSLL